jgi:hypothetical protein
MSCRDDRLRRCARLGDSRAATTKCAGAVTSQLQSSVNALGVAGKKFPSGRSKLAAFEKSIFANASVASACPASVRAKAYATAFAPYKKYERPGVFGKAYAGRTSGPAPIAAAHTAAPSAAYTGPTQQVVVRVIDPNLVLNCGSVPLTVTSASGYSKQFGAGAMTKESDQSFAGCVLPPSALPLTTLTFAVPANISISASGVFPRAVSPGRVRHATRTRLWHDGSKTRASTEIPGKLHPELTVAVLAAASTASATAATSEKLTGMPLFPNSTPVTNKLVETKMSMCNYTILTKSYNSTRALPTKLSRGGCGRAAAVGF